MADEDSRKRVKKYLEALADGDTVTLGDFTGQGEPEASDADVDAETLREIADSL